MTAPRPSREKAIGNGIAWMSRWSLRWVLVALGAVLVGLIVKEIWVILLPIVLALIVCTVLQSPARLLERRLHFPKALAAAASILGGLAIIVLILAVIAPKVVDQSSDIASDAAKGLQKIQGWVADSNLISDKQASSVVDAAQSKIAGSASKIASGVLVGVGAVTNAVVTLVVTGILTLLFLKDGHRFLPWLSRLAGPRVGPHLAEVSSRAWDTLGGFIRTQALVSLIDGVLIGAGLLIVQVPLAIPLAILTFFGGFVPIVGAFVVGAVAVLVALVSNGLTGGLIILGVIVAVQQLEGNVLSPILQSKSMNLHAAVVLLSVTLGSTLFGIVGAFLAVPTAAVTAVVLRYLDEQVTRVSDDPRPGLDDPHPQELTQPDPEDTGATVAEPEPAAPRKGLFGRGGKPASA